MYVLKQATARYIRKELLRSKNFWGSLNTLDRLVNVPNIRHTITEVFTGDNS